MNPIRSILINAQSEELRGKTTVGGVQALHVSGISGAVDLLVSCTDEATLAIAYVSASSLLHLIRTQALASRLARMREHSLWCYLIFRDALSPDTQGRTTHDGKATGWSWSSVQGALISVQELGIGILNIRDESFFDDAIVQLAKRDRGAKRLSPPRETLWATPAEQLLTSLPGVGPETADALLTECKGNAGLALAALTNARIAPAGISATRRTAIRTALGLASDQYLTIYNESDTDDDNRLSHDRQALAGA